MTGLLLADYFVIHRRRLHLSDLYIGDASSAYWYTWGINWRAVVSWAMGLWPLLPGFVRSVQLRNDYSGWDNLYDIDYFFGFVVAGATHVGLNLLFPVSGQEGGSTFEVRDKGMGRVRDSGVSDMEDTGKVEADGKMF